MWELNCKESWVLKNWCFWTAVLEKTLESPLDCKEIKPVHPKGNQSWVFIGRTDVETETPNSLTTWCEELTHWKRPWCWERLKVGEEGDDRGWDGWMATLTQWTWVWVNSRSRWWTQKPGVLQSMVSQRVGHNWATELNCWLISLWTTGSRFIYLIRSDPNVFLFMAVLYATVSSYSTVPQFRHPFICWWPSRLLPHSSYCKQCHNEHWGTCVFFSFGFLRTYA